jgi:capsular polysaccharide transport system ATP-binding protein
MIHLYNVSKYLFEGIEGARFVLRDATVSFPHGARLALLGDDRQALTTVLHLLAGSEVPDRGLVIADQIRRSPILNAGGVAGSCLVPRLSGRDNISFFSRVHGIDASYLVGIVESACRLGRLLQVPVREYDRSMRRALEITLMAALPYDFYFLDNLDQIETQMMWLLIHATRVRGASLVFTTRNLPTAAKLGQAGAVLSQGSIRVYPQVRKAIADHERR